MNDEHAIKQAVASFEGVMLSLTPTRISQLPRQPESPIERSFLIGLMGMSYWVPCYDFGDTFSRRVLRASDDFPTIRVELQAEVIGYRADFLLTVIHKGQTLGKVVVECDGHAFHERTKDQAARDRSRDRAMTLAGYKVMRFTGSELHRDLMRCIGEAHYSAWHFYSAPDVE